MRASRCAPSWTRTNTQKASRSPTPNSLPSISHATHSTVTGTTPSHRPHGDGNDLLIYGQTLSHATAKTSVWVLHDEGSCKTQDRGTNLGTRGASRGCRPLPDRSDLAGSAG